MEQAKKSGFAAIIGRPNVGKSTLMNRLIGQKIAITSSKPQTTRNRIQTVYTDERGQIIFLDTPGLTQARNKLGEYMMSTARKSLGDADVILWLVEAAPFIGPADRAILSLLAGVNRPLILVINKVDTIKKEEVLAVIDAFRKERNFDEIIPVSALKGTNTDEIVNEIFKYLPYGPQYYDEDTVTDQPVRQIAAEMIREKALYHLKDEVPHGIAVVIDKMDERRRDLTVIEASIVCERDSHKGIIIGKNGAMLKKIGQAARYEIERMLGTQVNLKLWVKVRKEWRDNELYLKNYGYYDQETRS